LWIAALAALLLILAFFGLFREERRSTTWLRGPMPTALAERVNTGSFDRRFLTPL
jgi:hypothetical protein